MFVLWRKLNYRNIRLDADNAGAEEVGVRRKDGSATLVRWLGFIELVEARKIREAIPVKLIINRMDNEFMEPGEFVQGCYLPSRDGVYAVYSATIRRLQTDQTAHN